MVEVTTTSTNYVHSDAPAIGETFSSIRWYFCFFLVSGFCSVLYEIVWLRLAMAQFGVTTGTVSLVLSAFMVGLGVGSWAAGYFVIAFKTRFQFSALRLYAFTELLIGLSAIIVPQQLLWGKDLMLKVVGGMSVSSPEYYSLSGVWLAITLVPWCACMGATFPFAMFAIKKDGNPDSERSFSYLYLANVLGAAAGAVIPLILIERFGFRGTLHVSAVLNLLLAAGAFSLSVVHRPLRTSQAPLVDRKRSSETCDGSGKIWLWLLFGTGLTSMGGEVVWVRLYSPSLGTMVYAFAAILGTYLAWMYVGSMFYRRMNNPRALKNGLLWVALGASVLVPFMSADPRILLPGIFRVVLGIMPYSALVGFITPMIVDRFSAGDAARAGIAYAANVGGCVLGPLVAGFLLLPLVGEKFALCVLALPWFVAGFKYLSRASIFPITNRTSWRFAVATWILTIGTVALAISTKAFENQFWPRALRRDSTATVVATGLPGGKKLYVNGVGITSLTPVTKIMAHLPLASLSHQPHSVLVVCFGMGTTHLSALSWGIQTTSVELVPSVPSVVGFFHPNAPTLLTSPLSHIVIDDGRRFLVRSSEHYDVITIDPPPPVEAAGSSLLYSRQFYAEAKRHLRDGGIMQQWLPTRDAAVTASVTRALTDSFPYVRAFASIEGFGHHFLVSMSPIARRSAAELAQRLPESAARDLIEWGPASSSDKQFALVIGREVSVASLIAGAPNIEALNDDRPLNEYFLLRRLREPGFRTGALRSILGIRSASRETKSAR